MQISVYSMLTVVMTSLLVVLMMSCVSVHGDEMNNKNVAYLENRGAALRRLLGFNEKGRCLWQMELCDPIEDRCCKRMRCANAMGSYCLRGFEKCYCVPENYGKSPSNWQ